jgi:membrane protein YdbS with pleckstrin-like domain
MSFLHKTSFWIKFEQTLSLIGGVGITTAGFEKAPYWVFIAFGICAVAAKIVFIWIEDKDNNGIIDWLEKK